MSALEIYNPIQGHNTHEEFQLQVRLMAGYLIEYLNRPEPIEAIMAASDSILPIVTGPRSKFTTGSPTGTSSSSVTTICGRICSAANGSQPLRLQPSIKKNLEIGHELMRLLQERIEGSLPPEGQHRVIKPELIIFQDS